MRQYIPSVGKVVEWTGKTMLGGAITLINTIYVVVTV